MKTPAFIKVVFVSLVFAGSCIGQQSRPLQASANLHETIQFRSKLVNATLPYNVIFPVDYYRATARRYPVLYLLHGFTGHYQDWITRTNVAKYASNFPLIVIMPEGNNGWYTDSATISTDKYETYIMQELIPDVQKRYLTIEAGYGRAIAGLSMGGYGAFKFALKYPGNFVLAASMSGAFGVTRFTEKEMGPGAPWEAFLNIFLPVGSETRKQNDVFDLIERLPTGATSSLPFFYFDCGTEDAPRILDPNRELSELMLRKHIAHEYRQLPGNHSWGYWDQQVRVVLDLAATKFIRPVGPISPLRPVRDRSH